MERPQPKPYSDIDFSLLRTKVIEATEQILNDLDEGWDEEEEMNNNEDILEDQNNNILEETIKAIYGDDFYEYFNSKV